MTRGDIGAVVLARTTQNQENMVREIAAMKGVSRVERVRGRYDLVIHVAGLPQVEAIERVPGVIAAEVCWLAPKLRGGHG